MGWGNTDLYYMSEIKGIQGVASLKTSHFADPEGNREASPVRKRVRPPLLNVHRIQSRYLDLKKKRKLLKLKDYAKDSQLLQTKYF
jgi:hypothetical protein